MGTADDNLPYKQQVGTDVIISDFDKVKIDDRDSLAFENGIPSSLT